jgi:hypothetical protein
LEEQEQVLLSAMLWLAPLTLAHLHVLTMDACHTNTHSHFKMPSNVINYNLGGMGCSAGRQKHGWLLWLCCTAECAPLSGSERH